MLKDINFDHSSEAKNFKYDSKDTENSDSVLDQIEGMRDEHVSEELGASRDSVDGVDQAPDGMNDQILNFRTKLESADLSDQTTLDELNDLIAKIAEEDSSQAETLKEEMMTKKIE